MEEPLSDIQRQRMELVDVFEAPHNLPVAEYAKMAGKSRRWISYEIKAGNLLALNLGNRGQRVPDDGQECSGHRSCGNHLQFPGQSPR